MVNDKGAGEMLLALNFFSMIRAIGGKRGELYGEHEI